MKRHGFKGQPASHGVSLVHRSMGSAGQSQGGGSRVYPGKKMAGRHGGEQKTIQNVQVLKVDGESGVVVLKGACFFYLYNKSSQPSISWGRGRAKRPLAGFVFDGRFSPPPLHIPPNLNDVPVFFPPTPVVLSPSSNKNSTRPNSFALGEKQAA